MQPVGFFDRVMGNRSIADCFEDYFYLDGFSHLLGFRRLVVKDPADGLATNDTSNPHDRTLLNIVKFTSYFLPPIFLAMLIGKAVLRSQIASVRLDNDPDEHIRHVRKMRHSENYMPDINQLRGKRLFGLGMSPAHRALEDLPEVCKAREEMSNVSSAKFDENHKRRRPMAKVAWSLDRGSNYREGREKIFEKGIDIAAHGVEALKGGICNLLNIMLDGAIMGIVRHGAVQLPWYGSLVDGDPSYCAGPHGPYYVILTGFDIDTSSPRAQGGFIEEKYHKAYLVPEEKHKQFLSQALANAVKLGMLTESEKQVIEAKIVTYDEFLALSG